MSSSNVLVNQTITISCLFETGQEGVGFHFPNNIICIAQYCSKTCGKFSLECPNNQTYRINATVSPSWHKKELYCGHLFGGPRSNIVTLDIISKTLFKRIAWGFYGYNNIKYFFWIYSAFTCKRFHVSTVYFQIIYWRFYQC